MTRAILLTFFLLLLSSSMACRAFELGLEPYPPPANDGASPSPTATIPQAPRTLRAATVFPTVVIPKTSERITFPQGATAYSFTSDLSPDSPRGYVLAILSGQQLFISATNRVLISVLGTDGKPLPPAASAPGSWQGTVPVQGDYTVVLSGQGTTNVTVVIPPPNAPSSTHTPGP